MSPYSLRCTLCERSFNGREKWLRHLTSERHQTRARLDCANWGKEERKCVLVVFSSAAIDSQSAKQILQNFGTEDMGGLVTDFVTFPDRRRVGLLQFESREKVTTILKGLERTGRATELSLDGFRLHLRRAKSYFDFEWTELILAGSATFLSPSPETSLMSKPKPPRSTKNTPVLPKTECMQEPSTPPELSGYHCEATETSMAAGNPSNSRNPSESDHSSRFKSDLRRQFKDLSRIVEIPPEEYSKALGIVFDMQQLLSPDYLVSMYRYWYLGLRSPGDDLLSLFTSERKNLTTTEKLPCSSFPGLRKFLTRAKAAKLFVGFGVTKGGAEGCSTCPRQVLFFNKVSRIRFAVTSFPPVLAESQLCALASYLCTFDPRVKPLLMLVFAWARANQVEFGRESLHWNYVISKCIPEPASMVWLVLHFLISRGILPTPRVIQGRPHQRMMHHESGKLSFDLGFEPDEKFAEEWRKKRSDRHFEEDVVPNVLGLARDLFEYFSKFGPRPNRTWVLNTRDGEVYEKAVFMNRKAKTSLGLVEIKVLRGKLRAKGSRGCSIFVMHPLDPGCRLSFTRDDLVAICRKMRKTAANLRSMLARECRTDIHLEKVLSADGSGVEWSERSQCDTDYGFWKEGENDTTAAEGVE